MMLYICCLPYVVSRDDVIHKYTTSNELLLLKLYYDKCICQAILALELVQYTMQPRLCLAHLACAR